MPKQPPVIVTARKPRSRRSPKAAAEATPAFPRIVGRRPAATEQPPDTVGTSSIVTAKRKPGRFGAAPNLTEEEHQRRGDAADALFRELVRRAKGEP